MASGVLSEQKGDLDPARSAYGESLTIRRSVGDQGGIAAALLGLGDLAVGEKAYDDARELDREGLTLAES